MTWAENESSNDVTQFPQSFLPSMSFSGGRLLATDTGAPLQTFLLSPKLMQLSLQLMPGKERMNLARDFFFAAQRTSFENSEAFSHPR